MKLDEIMKAVKYDRAVSFHHFLTTPTARVVLFSVVSVCDFVCLFVCQHDNAELLEILSPNFQCIILWSKGSK